MCLLQFQWSPEPLVFVYEYEDENQARIRHYKLETQTVGQDISKNFYQAFTLSSVSSYNKKVVGSIPRPQAFLC